MAVKKILLYPDPLLLRTSARIDTFDENLMDFVTFCDNWSYLVLKVGILTHKPTILSALYGFRPK